VRDNFVLRAEVLSLFAEHAQEADDKILSLLAVFCLESCAAVHARKCNFLLRYAGYGSP
jgi:hypothetical protein